VDRGSASSRAKIEWRRRNDWRMSRTVAVGNGLALFTPSANLRANTVRAGMDYKFGP